MLAGEVTAVERAPGPRARAARRTPRRLGATNVHVVERRRDRAAAGADGLRPRARRRAVLGARRPRRAPRPALARPQPLPELQLALLRAAAERVEARRDGRLLGLHAQRRRERGRRRRLGARGRAARRRVAAVRAIRRAPGVPADRAAPATARRGFFIARAARPRKIRRWPGATGSARSRSSRRSTRRTSRELGGQIEVLLDAGARIFHFDCGDGHFVEPVTIGPIVLQSIAPSDPRDGRGDRLPPDGRRTREALRRVREGGRATA